jgi:hypothetical protein
VALLAEQKTRWMAADEMHLQSAKKEAGSRDDKLGSDDRRAPDTNAVYHHIAESERKAPDGRALTRGGKVWSDRRALSDMSNLTPRTENAMTLTGIRKTSPMAAGTNT